MGKERKGIRPKLITPYAPIESDKAYHENFVVQTNDRKIVSDYAGIPLLDVVNLDVFTYWGLLHDAVIWNCRKTTAGREYLNDAWIHMQDKPDRTTLRAQFGGGKKRG